MIYEIEETVEPFGGSKREGESSPWGRIQYVHKIADGLCQVGTAGHGGIWVSKERLKQMPKKFRLGRRQWFEEDCEAALVILAFPQFYEHVPKAKEYAEKMYLRMWGKAKEKELDRESMR